MRPKSFLRPVAFFAFSLLCGVQIAAQGPAANDCQTGLLYGPNHAYSLTAPTGWVLDNQAWADMGIHAVFYPKGSSPEGMQVAYTRFFPPSPKGVESGADDDLAKFKLQHPSAQIKSYPGIKNRYGLKVALRRTITPDQPNAEWLAYIEAPTGIIFIAVVTKSPSEIDFLKARFNELIDSCRWLTDKVTIGK